MSGMGAVELLDTAESWRPLVTKLRLLADLATLVLRLSALTASGASVAPCLLLARIWSTLRLLVHGSPDSA